MKNHQKFKKKLLVAAVASLLISQSSQTTNDFTFATITIASQGNAQVTPCSGSNTQAQQIADAIRAGQTSTFQDFVIEVFFITAGSGVPECAQQATSHPSPPRAVANGMVFTITSQNEGNQGTISAIKTGGVLSLLTIGDGPALTSGQFDPAISGLTLPTGVIFVVMHDETEESYYYKSVGGYSFDCHPSCGTNACTGTAQNECTSCSSHASVVGSTLHSSLNGRCFCPSGKLSTDGSSCESVCTGFCGSCNSASASECFTCPSTVGYSITRGANGMGSCTVHCH